MSQRSSAAAGRRTDPEAGTDDNGKTPRNGGGGAWTIPRWLGILTSITIVIIGGLVVACLVLLTVISIRGVALKADVDTGMNAIQSVAGYFPSVAYYMQLFANATLSASSVSVASALSGGGGSSVSAVPPVLYSNLSTLGVRMAYRAMGPCAQDRSPVVLFVHDLTASSLEWIEEMTLLASEDFCVIAIDMLGHGNSDSAQTASGGSITSQVSYLHAFLTEAGLLSDYSRRLVLGGSGFGGAVAASYMFGHDGTVDELILHNPMPYAVYSGDTGATKASVTGGVSTNWLQSIAALQLSNSTAFATLIASALSLNTVCTPTALSAVTKAYTLIGLQAEPLTVVQGLLSMQTIDLRSSLSLVITPTLLIAGGGTLPRGAGLNYALLASAARNLIGSAAILHVIGSASRAPLLTHSSLVHGYIKELLDGSANLCDAAPLSFLSVG